MKAISTHELTLIALAVGFSVIIGFIAPLGWRTVIVECLAGAVGVVCFAIGRNIYRRLTKVRFVERLKTAVAEERGLRRLWIVLSGAWLIWRIWWIAENCSPDWFNYYFSGWYNMTCHVSPHITENITYPNLALRLLSFPAIALAAIFAARWIMQGFSRDPQKPPAEPPAQANLNANEKDHRWCNSDGSPTRQAGQS